jgi:hypothetical protein
MLYLTILLIFVFFAAAAMTINEGLWSNTVLLLCIILSGLAAIFCGSPLGLFIIEKADASDEYAWHCIFAGVWGVFASSVLIMRVLFEKSSRTRVKFVPPLERVAGPLMGLFVAVMFASFAAYTMERIPIRAGHWPMADASDWKTTTFTYARAPFHNVVKRFAESEKVRSDFFPKSR